jgi:anti-sigma regulatory factor (Ser/Thr protein kinase)
MSSHDLFPIASLTVPSDPGYLSVCRQALVGAVDGLPIPDDDLDDLKLVLSEACANAIVHAYGSTADGVIEIQFRGSRREIEVTVSDRGPGFPGGRVPDIAGAGLSLLARLCNRHSIEPCRPGGGAAVTFARSIIS